MEIDAAREIAIRLSFHHFVDMRGGSRSLAEAAQAFDSLSGVYLHIRSDGSLYIGKAANVVNRHQQHLSQGHPFEYLAFVEAPPGRLDDAESAAIERARRMNCRLANRSLKDGGRCGPIEQRSFDELVPPDAQDAWIAAAREGRTHPARQLARVASLAEHAHQEAWAGFMKHPRAEEMLDAAALYLGVAVPDPEALEGLRWSVGIARFNFQNRRVPLLWLSAGTRCIFECFAFTQTERAVFADMLFASSIVCRDEKTKARLTQKTYNWASWRIPEKTTLPAAEALLASRVRPAYATPIGREDLAARAAELKRPAFLEMLLEPVHAAAALDHAPLLLEDPDLAEAAAVGALACMRAKPLPKTESHNPIAAHAILSRIGRTVQI